MSTRGVILLAVGMLILGLLLGMLSGGAAGFFIGQNSRVAVSRNVLSPRQPAQPQPAQPQPQPAQPHPTQPTPFSPPRGLPPFENIVNGARVMEVEKDSPAAKAGLQVGDVITAVGSTKIDDKNSLADLIQARKPGDKVDLAVTRGTQTLTITVELGAASDNSNTARLGIRYAPAFSGGNRFRFPTPGSSLPNG